MDDHTGETGCFVPLSISQGMIALIDNYLFPYCSNLSALNSPYLLPSACLSTYNVMFGVRNLIPLFCFSPNGVTDGLTASPEGRGALEMLMIIMFD